MRRQKRFFKRVFIKDLCPAVLALILACAPLKVQAADTAKTSASSQSTAATGKSSASTVKSTTGSTAVAATDPNAAKRASLTIMIDPGHQQRGNRSRESIGPGSRKTKAKVSYGTCGVVTHTPEYKLNLAVAKQLKAILQKRGYKVLMTRETNKVNISNKKRAQMANKAKADVFVRIHANGSTSRRKNGVLTICMTKKSPYNKKLYKDSYALSKSILNATVKSTKAKKLTVMQSNTYTGINWSKVPVTIVEMGYMSNASEDRKMAKKSYRYKLATGIANGIENYFKKKYPSYYTEDTTAAGTAAK